MKKILFAFMFCILVFSVSQKNLVSTIRSVTKQFIPTGILKLIERGKLKIAFIYKYLFQKLPPEKILLFRLTSNN